MEAKAQMLKYLTSTPLIKDQLNNLPKSKGKEKEGVEDLKQLSVKPVTDQDLNMFLTHEQNKLYHPELFLDQTGKKPSSDPDSVAMEKSVLEE